MESPTQTLVRRRGLLAALCATAALLLLPAIAGATTNYTWSGGAGSGDPNWLDGSNWSGGSSPSGTVGTLDFPALTSSGCTPGLGFCYTSNNNVPGLTAAALQFGNGSRYLLSGDGIELGSGGITVELPGGCSGSPGFDEIEFPITLNEDQTWSVKGSEDCSGGILSLDGGVSGETHRLTVTLTSGAELGLGGDIETGPLTIDDGTGNDSFDGFLDTFPATSCSPGCSETASSLNASDGNSVTITGGGDASLDGKTGPLSTIDTILGVGTLEPASATLNSETKVTFAVGETHPSELISKGAVMLANASLAAYDESQSCAALSVGHVYTLVSTTGTLSGVFGSVTEGGHVPLGLVYPCSQSTQELEIHYHTSGEPQTVTATVIEESKTVTKEEEKKKEEETVATKKHEEEEAAAKKKKEEEAATKGSGGGSSTPSTTSTTPTTTTTPATGSVSLDGSSITVQSSGKAQVKLTCTGTATCGGTLTLTAKTKSKGKKKAKTETIGTSSFSIPAAKTATVTLTLTGTGRALLSAAHGKLTATLAILKSSPGPSNTQTHSVHLAQQKATKAKKGKK